MFSSILPDVPIGNDNCHLVLRIILRSACLFDWMITIMVGYCLCSRYFRGKIQNHKLPVFTLYSISNIIFWLFSFLSEDRGSIHLIFIYDLIVTLNFGTVAIDIVRLINVKQGNLFERFAEIFYEEEEEEESEREKSEAKMKIIIRIRASDNQNNQ